METLYSILCRSTLLFEGLALLAALITLPKYSKTILLLFLPFLTYVFVTEVLGSTVFTCSNQLLYNPELLMENGVYLLSFMYVFKSKLLIQISRIILIVFVVVTLTDIYFLESFSKEILSVSFNVGRILILIEYFLYLFVLLQSNEYLELSRNLFFWLSTGIFIFILLTFLRDTLLGLEADLSVNEKYVIKMSGFVASNILYSCFIAGFLRCKKMTHV